MSRIYAAFVAALMSLILLSCTGQDSRASVSAGKDHSCAVLESGEAVCWGDNIYGQADVPEGKYLSVSAGRGHSCGVRESGEVVCWGWHHVDRGEGVVVERVRHERGKFRFVSAGVGHNCGILDSGAVICWGQTIPEQLPEAPEGRYRSVSAGFVHNCGILESGAIVCWWVLDEATHLVDSIEVPEGMFRSVSVGRESVGEELRRSAGGTAAGISPLNSLTFLSVTCAGRELGGGGLPWGNNDDGRMRCAGRDVWSVSAGMVIIAVCWSRAS